MYVDGYRDAGEIIHSCIRVKKKNLNDKRYGVGIGIGNEKEKEE